MLASLIKDLFSAKAKNKAVQAAPVVQPEDAVGTSVDATHTDLFFAVVKPDGVNVMPTTKCNLKCEYCLSSGKHASRESLIDASSGFIEKIEDLLKREHPRPHMILSGGEVTFMDDWCGLVKKLQDDGLPVLMITNLAKIMSDKEIETLASLHEVLISVDTPDRELARRYRSKTQLENIVYNIIRIRSYCAGNARPLPHLTFHCTLGSQTVKSLPALVAMAHACGVPRIHVNEVTMHGDFQFEYKPVTFFTEKSREETVKIVNDASAMGARLGVRLSFVYGLVDAIQNVASEKIETGQTRLCFDPWKILLFGADGAIHTCCNGYPAVANLEKVASLQDVFFSEKNNGCKTELLTGNLNPACRKCTRRPVVSVEEFGRQLTGFLKA